MDNRHTRMLCLLALFILGAAAIYKICLLMHDEPAPKLTTIYQGPTQRELIRKEISRREREIEDRAYQIQVEATAYWVMDPVEASGTGIAADGTPAVPYKTIAVDPKVIPLQSKVYVPGIGWCRANDTGGAVKGNIIDVAMESRESAFKWGRRNILIKVIPPKS